MSTTVDQRVVEMRFDNKHFENNIANTMSTLEKFKQKLNLDGATKGLENIDTAAKKVNLSSLGNATEAVGLKFNALWTVADQTLRNITNSVEATAKRMISAVTIDPIKTGLQEYETQINAVQTILANTESKGTTLDQVNSALDTLNEYADKTIYNFTEMTRNIGTFTAAGVDLDTSVNAIQGIANLAAVSGSTSQQASTAMYQLSQALSSGTVKLMDWNSVVNAGMGGQVFQDALKETARVHGMNIDKLIEKEGSFRETLQHGWLTADILTETLSHFTMAAEEGTAQWNEYKKSLMDSGYSEEQANAILKMSNTATDAATKVKTATQLFDTLKETAQSGWTQTWELIFGDFEDAKTLFSELYGTLAPILEASAKARNELLQGWADAGGRDDLIKSLYNVFDAIGSIVKPIKEAFSEIFPPATAQQLVNITKSIKEFTAKLTLSESASDKLKRTFKGLFAVIDIVKQAFGAVLKALSPLFGKVDDLGGGILGVTAKWGDWLVKLNESIKTSGFFTTAIEKIQITFEKIGKFLAPVVEGFKRFANEVATSLSSVSVNVEKRLGPLATLGNFIKSVFVSIGNAVRKVFPYVSAAATGIGNVLKDLMDTIADSIQNANYDSFFDLTSGGILTAIGVYITKFFKSGSGIFDGAAGFVENLNGILEGAGDALGAFTDSLKADTLKKIAVAIAILAAALLVLTLIPSERLTSSLLAVTTLFAELMGSMSILSKMGDTKGIAKIAGALVALSAALLVMSVALKIMSTMSWEEMGVGLISMTVGLGALVTAVNLLPDKKVKNAAKAIKTLSTAILILAVGIKIMSTMSWEEMGVGLISMVVGLGALVGAVNLLPKDTALRALGMVGLATAMVVLAAALKIMATLSWDDVARSLVTLGGSLLILAGAMALMKNALPGAAAMLVVAPALVVLAGALKIMSSLSWEEIAKGLITLAGSLLIIAGAMALMKTAISGAGALLVVSAALAILAPVLKSLGSMDIDEIGKSLLMLAGTFTVIGLAALILKPLVPTILALSGAIALLGVACAAIGAGAVMLGAGLAAIAAALAASGGAITIFVASLISLIPFLIEQIGVGIIRLCDVIAGSADAICKAATVIILALVDALVASVPAIAEGALVLIEELLKSLVNHTPTIVMALFDFLIGILDAISAKLPDLIKAGVNLIMAFFQGVIDALKSIDPNVLVNGILAIGMITALMTSMAAIAALTPAAMTGVLGAGAVIAELALVLAAIGALAQIPGLDWIIGEGGDLLQTIGTAIGQFFGGIAGGFAQGMSAALPQIGSDLTAFMENAEGFIEGAKKIDASTMDGVKSIVGIIAALTAVDILQGLTSWITGGSSLTKFGEELAAFGPNFKAYADSIAGIDPAVVTASATAAKALAEMTSCIPNEGGVAAWFAGENSISKFGTELVTLGAGLASYSDSIVNFNGDAVIASANAAKALADMTSHIPNEGGVAAWFAGENSISKFGKDLESLGESLAGYSNSIADFNGDAVIASANAAKALADMTSCIPNEGGLVAWFTGENSISKFGNELRILGVSLAAYSNAIGDFNADAVIASANAAKALVDMTSNIPNEGGMVAWFTGENSISKFGTELVSLGGSLAGFSTAVAGVDAESMTAAANAAKTLAEMASYIPNEGGVVAWFTGENSIAKFGTELVNLGTNLAAFSTEVAGINATNVSAAAGAAKSLAEMASYIPNEGGLAAWFTGDKSIAKFAEHFPGLGKGLKGLSDAVQGMSATNVSTAANAAKTLAEISNTVPDNGEKLKTFGDDIKKFGNRLDDYFETIDQIRSEAVTKSSTVIEAAKSASTGLDSGKLSKAADALGDLAESMIKLCSISASSADGFRSAIQKIANTNISSMIAAFSNAGSDMKSAGIKLIQNFASGAQSQEGRVKRTSRSAMDKFIEGLEERETAAKTTSIKIVKSCAGAISNLSSKFKSAGKDLGSGLVLGIQAKETAVYNAAYALGQKAVQGEKDGQKSKSPSKATIQAGNWLGEGLIIGMNQMGSKVYNTGSTLGEKVTKTMSATISRLSDMISGDVDSQPTIRPVLDLSDVESGVSAIGGMLNTNSAIGVRANIGAISSVMSTRGQNGANSDVVSALDKLSKKMDNLGNTIYNVNGITYDDGSNITDAVRTLVRAAQIERRA